MLPLDARALPWAGAVRAIRVVGSRLPSGTVSLATTFTPTGVASGVVALSLTATGGWPCGGTLTRTGAGPRLSEGSQAVCGKGAGAVEPAAAGQVTALVAGR